jgi:hypothetical protein
MTRYKYHTDGSDKHDASGYYAMLQDMAAIKVLTEVEKHAKANRGVYGDKPSFEEVLKDMATAKPVMSRTFDVPVLAPRLSRVGKPAQKRRWPIHRADPNRYLRRAGAFLFQEQQEKKAFAGEQLRLRKEARAKEDALWKRLGEK